MYYYSDLVAHIGSLHVNLPKTVPILFWIYFVATTHFLIHSIFLAFIAPPLICVSRTFSRTSQKQCRRIDPGIGI